MPVYDAIKTNIGHVKYSAADAGGPSVTLTTVEFTDGLGVFYVPDENDLNLPNIVWSGPVNAVEQSANNPSAWVAEGRIPVAVGGFNIRGMGFRDQDGDLVIVASVPLSYKPTLAENAQRDQYYRTYFQHANASAVTVIVDPTVVMATRDYADANILTYVDQVLKTTSSPTFANLTITTLLNGGVPHTTANDGIGSNVDAGLFAGLLPSAYAQLATLSNFTVAPTIAGATIHTSGNDGVGGIVDASLFNGLATTQFARLASASNFTVAPTINGGTIWTSLNDGVGSGLDAHTLGGYLPAALAVLSENESVTGLWTFTSRNIFADYQYFRRTDSSSIFSFYQNSSTGSTDTDGFRIGIGSDESAQFWNFESTALRIATNNTERMRIDENGNIGFGTADMETWGSLYRAFQLGDRGYLMFGSSVEGTHLGSNLYYDGVWKHKISGEASSVVFVGGNIQFRTAASGAGNAVATNSTRGYIDNDGGLVFGAPIGNSKTIGTGNFQNGIYCNGTRNTRTIWLDSPEIIISTSVPGGAWVTVNNTTLNNASAITAHLRLYINLDLVGTNSTDYYYGDLYLRKTGSALTPGFTTRGCTAAVENSVAGQGDMDRSAGQHSVNLNANNDFDYFMAHASSGSSSVTYAVVLVGYDIEC